MKKIFLILIILAAFSFSMFAQETNAAVEKKGLLPPYLSVFQAFEGISFVGGGYKSHTGFITTTYVNLTLGKRVFFDMPIGSTVYTIVTDNALFGLSYGIGAGVYIFDKRNGEGKGNSLKTSFLYSGKLLIDTAQKEFSKSILLMSGGQIFLTYQRHFYENFALRVGLIFGVHAVEQNNPVAINYGLSIGLAF